MKVLMINLETPEDISMRTGPAGKAFRDEWGAYFKAVGHKVIGGHPIDVSVTPTLLRKVDGTVQVQDRPVTDSQESFGGYFILEVDTLEEAIKMASMSPGLKRGAVELHVIAEMGKKQ